MPSKFRFSLLINPDTNYVYFALKSFKFYESTIIIWTIIKFTLDIFQSLCKNQEILWKLKFLYLIIVDFFVKVVSATF